MQVRPLRPIVVGETCAVRVPLSPAAAAAAAAAARAAAAAAAAAAADDDPDWLGSADLEFAVQSEAALETAGTAGTAGTVRTAGTAAAATGNCVDSVAAAVAAARESLGFVYARVVAGARLAPGLALTRVTLETAPGTRVQMLSSEVFTFRLLAGECGKSSPISGLGI